MYLTQIVNSNFFFSTLTKRNQHKNDDDEEAAFNDTVFSRLESLSPPPSIISLSWLCSAFDFLSSTHCGAAKHLSGSKLPPLTDAGVDDSLSFYLDDSLEFMHLNICIISEIDRLRRRALLIKIALHLLTGDSVSSPDKLKNARDCLSKMEEVGPRKPGDDLVMGLASKLKEAAAAEKSGTVSAFVRAVHSVGLVSILIAGAAVSVLRGSAVAEGGTGLVAPGEFEWVGSLNEPTRKLGDAFWCRREIKEVADVEAQVKNLIKMIDDVADGKGEEELNDVVKELGRLTEDLTEAFGKFGEGVRGCYGAVMRARRCALDKISRSLGD